jgi:hypothetical protein
MKNFIIFILSIALCHNVSSQKIQYGRGTFQVDDPKEMQFVANIGGSNHLIKFTPNRRAFVYIYDSQLQLTQKKNLGFMVSEGCTIKILSFPGYYYVYVHKLRPSIHELWKIDAQGEVTEWSQKFRGVIDSVLKNYEATIQLVNADGHLTLLANTYYDTIKSIKSTAISLDEQLNPLEVRKALYPFDKGKETLQQTELINGVLFALKVSRDRESGSPLELVKLNMANGESVTSTFSSTTLLHGTPAFIFDPKDSSVLVYSLATERTNVFGNERPVFISRLNYSLQEQVPVTLLRSQFSNNTAINYLLLGGTSPAWIKMGRTALLGDVNSYTPTAVRLTLLDEHFKKVDDTLIANRKMYDVQPVPFGRANVNNKACLFLIQNLTRKRKGLLMISAKEGRLETSGIRVFDKYDYMLSQIHVKDDYVICPYIYKNEMGLIKITIN